MLIFFHVLQLTLLYFSGSCLCYAPFHDKLRLSFAKLTGALFLLFTGMIGIYIFIYTASSHDIAHFWFLATLPICGAFYLWSIRESYRKTIFILLVVTCYEAFICGCAAFISSLLFSEGLQYEILYTVTTLFIGGATYLLLYNLVMERIAPLINILNHHDLYSVYFMPAFYIVLQSVFFILYDLMNQMTDLVYFVVLVAVNVSTCFVTTDILHSLNSLVDKKRMQNEIFATEKLLELQKSQYTSWLTQIEAVRRARHDLKYHITTVQAFLDKNDCAGLQEHVREFQRTLPASAPLLLCKNMNINALLLYYYERAQKENVKLTFLADVPEKIGIHPQDLAVVFGNCLENAFEACARMEASAEKTVSLMAKPLGKSLAIIIDNTFDGNFIVENGIYLSSKRNHQMGIGMSSVNLIVQKYNGIASFETEGNLFMTSIRLHEKNTEEEACHSEK